MGYKKQAILGIGWTGLLQFSIKFLALLKFTIILRILTPFEFGLFGMSMVVIDLFETFSEFGIGTFLIQQSEKMQEYLSSVWTVQLIRGVLLSIFIAGFAIPSSIFFKQSALVPMILVGALIPLVKAFENPAVINFQKNLHFGREFFYRLISVVSDVFFSVWICLFTKSVFGLLFGLLISACIGSAFSWAFVKEKPFLIFKQKEIKKILGFAKSISFLGIVTYITTQIDSIFIGKMLGSSSLGYYQVGQKFSTTPMTEVSDIFGKVSFPVYSKFSSDKIRLKKAYVKTAFALFLIELLGFLFILFFSKQFILIVSGPQWVKSVPILKILAIYGFLHAVWGSIGALFLSVKRQDILIKLASIRIVFLIPSIFFGLRLFGLIGAAYGLLMGTLCIFPLTLFYINRLFLKNEKKESTM